MPKAKKQKGVHYVDNKEFLEAIIEFKEICNDAKEKEIERPPVSN